MMSLVGWLRGCIVVKRLDGVATLLRQQGLSPGTASHIVLGGL